MQASALRDVHLGQFSEYAVAVSGADDGRGSGFFGRYKGRLSFYTAGHNLGRRLQERSLPVEDWAWLDPLVNLHPAHGDREKPTVSLPLYTERSSTKLASVTRQPLFTWATFSPDRMWDAVAFDVAGSSTDLEHHAAQFDIADLDDAVNEMTNANTLFCVGFPPKDDQAAWPYFPPAAVRGNFVEHYERPIRADSVPETGISGGPVFAGDGRIAGMIVGVDSGANSRGIYHYARIVPSRLLIHLAASQVR
jgi:hypothetical protein